MKLIYCDTLVNIEGTVYKLSRKDYDSFKSRFEKAWKNSNSYYHSDQPNGETWDELLHWVIDHGKVKCHVDSYNF
jgi:hypothetical protein